MTRWALGDEKRKFAPSKRGGKKEDREDFVQYAHKTSVLLCISARTSKPKKLIKTPLTKENESAIICKLSTRQQAVSEERTRAGLRTAGWMSESGEQHDKMSRQNITKKS